MKLLIVGGVAGGASAAARARRLSESAEIIVFERGPDVSFANCGLPYYIGGKIADRNKLLVTTPERLRTRFRLDVRTESEVQQIDRQAKTIHVRELSTGREYQESYDKLILAPGAAPIRPSLPGMELPGVVTLRNLHDTDHIKRYVDQKIQHVVVVGGGFIGLELVENFVRQGISTLLVQLQDQVMSVFDKEMTVPLERTLKEKGVALWLNDSADRIEKSPEGLTVHFKSGKQVATQLVVLGIGVRPESRLAADADLAVGPRGGIRVNQYLQTSDPDIYAVGDVIEVQDVISGNPTQIPLAGPANRQGRIAADNVFGRSSRYRGTQGTAILGLFDKTIAMTGSSEKMLRQSGRPCKKVYIHPTQHAGYYPGAQPMTLKLLFDAENGRILGAQAIGTEGVDKRIDIISLAIQAKMTVYDLEEVELSYAPQFGSAKDPINMAGFVASGLLRGDHPQIGIENLLASPVDQRPFLIDVRTPEEFGQGAIPGAVNIPIDELRQRREELPRDRKIAVYCQVGQRGYLALRILLQSGFDVANISGGYKTFQLFEADKT